MERRSIYLDTSIISFYYADDAPDLRQATRDFFDDYVRPGIYEVFVSAIVSNEISRTRDPKRRRKLLKVIEDYELQSLDIAVERADVESLAGLYIKRGIIPRIKLEDALHIAIATVKNLDVLLSWNYKHLANMNKEVLVQSVNMRAGYRKPLRMVTPLEVMYEKD